MTDRSFGTVPVRPCPELLFDGRDEVLLLPDPRLDAAEVARVARLHGYEFARGKRSGRYGTSDFWCFRLLYQRPEAHR